VHHINFTSLLGWVAVTSARAQQSTIEFTVEPSSRRLGLARNLNYSRDQQRQLDCLDAKYQQHGNCAVPEINLLLSDTANQNRQHAA
jgi:hypothetical protein